MSRYYDIQYVSDALTSSPASWYSSCRILNFGTNYNNNSEDDDNNDDDVVSRDTCTFLCTSVSFNGQPTTSTFLQSLKFSDNVLSIIIQYLKQNQYKDYINNCYYYYNKLVSSLQNWLPGVNLVSSS